MKNKEPPYELHLFITGASPNSVRAIGNIKNICDNNFPGKYKLEIIDVYQQPAFIEKEQIIALPMLIKKFPLPVRKFIGDMSDTAKVINGLD